MTQIDFTLLLCLSDSAYRCLRLDAQQSGLLVLFAWHTKQINVTQIGIAQIGTSQIQYACGLVFNKVSDVPAAIIKLPSCTCPERSEMRTPFDPNRNPTSRFVGLLASSAPPTPLICVSFAKTTLPIPSAGFRN